MGQGASIGGVEIEKPEGASIEQVTNANVALVFVKPHAANEKVIEFVKAELEKKLTVLGTCSLGAAAIEAGGLVDKHYAGICKNALETEPFELAVSDEAKAAFQAKFEKSYDEMISSGAILNSKQFMESEGGGTPDAPMAPKVVARSSLVARRRFVFMVESERVRESPRVDPRDETPPPFLLPERERAWRRAGSERTRRRRACHRACAAARRRGESSSPGARDRTRRTATERAPAKASPRD